MMSLVSSARRHDLDSRLYVEDVLRQLLEGCTDYERLLPDIWEQSRPEAIRQYRQEERLPKPIKAAGVKVMPYNSLMTCGTFR